MFAVEGEEEIFCILQDRLGKRSEFASSRYECEICVRMCNNACVCQGKHEDCLATCPYKCEFSDC
jgi:hypothetical protein